MDAIIKCMNIHKQYGKNEVLVDFNANVEKGSFTTISGKSGCGKSTLMNIIGLLDTSDKGRVLFYDDREVNPFTREASRFLRHNIGYLFQNFALVDEESVEYNLLIAISHVKKRKRKGMIHEALKRVGLEGFEHKKIYQCSGGEQQRIAIARLLLKECDIILADEPTGSLDEENKWIILNLLKELQNIGKTILVVTHDPEVMEIADFNIRM